MAVACLAILRLRGVNCRSARWDVTGPHFITSHVSLEPRAILSCPLESARVLALQEEVKNMLQKGILKVDNQPDPSFYSCLFLKKTTGGWRPVIDLS